MLKQKDATIAALRRKRDAFDAAMRLLESIDEDVLAILQANLGAPAENDNGSNRTVSTPTEPERPSSQEPRHTFRIREATSNIASPFTVNDVHRYLSGIGYEIDTKRPKATIGDVLRKMVSEGFLIIKTAGKGRREAVYEKSDE